MYLNTFGESLELVSRERNARLALRDQRHDGDAGMATNNWAVDGRWVQSLLQPMQRKFNRLINLMEALDPLP